MPGTDKKPFSAAFFIILLLFLVVGVFFFFAWDQQNKGKKAKWVSTENLNTYDPKEPSYKDTIMSALPKGIFNIKTRNYGRSSGKNRSRSRNRSRTRVSDRRGHGSVVVSSGKRNHRAKMDDICTRRHNRLPGSECSLEVCEDSDFCQEYLAENDAVEVPVPVPVPVYPPMRPYRPPHRPIRPHPPPHRPVRPVQPIHPSRPTGGMRPVRPSRPTRVSGGRRREGQPEKTFSCSARKRD